MKKITILLTFLWAFTLPLSAQNNTPTDSLERVFNAAATDTARLSVLINAQIYDYLAQTDQALVLYQKGLAIAQKAGEDKKAVQLMLCIGDLYEQGKLNGYEALPWYQKALELGGKIGDDAGCARACDRIGFIYDHQGLRDKMYDYTLKSVYFTEKTALPRADYFTTLIYRYNVDNRLNEAYTVGKRLEQLEDKGYFKGQQKLEFYGYFLQILKKMPDKQKETKIYKDKILQIIDTIDLGDDVVNIGNVAYFCLDINRPDLAIKLATKLLTVKTTRKSPELAAYGHKYLAEAYEMLGNYPLSTKHYKAYAAAQVDFVTTSLTNQSREKTLIIESEKALLIKQNEIDKQKWWVISGFCVAAVFLMSGLIIYHFFKREQKIKQELATLNATKDKLFALLTHDLMSPIANFKNILMLTDFGLLSQTEFKAIAKDLSLKAHNLHSMFENVLHWAITQLKGIKTKFEKTNIAAVVNEQISLLEPRAKGKQIEIKQLIPNDLVIDLDKNHLALVIRNILQNALKFTHTNGNIVFNSQNTEGGKKTISISDNGIGMTETIRNQLFQMDKNVQRKGTSAESGTGLGLILTHELIKLNGGTISVTSEAHQGTTFTLTFG